jgi:hypothetical protein
MYLIVQAVEVSRKPVQDRAAPHGDALDTRDRKGYVAGETDGYAVERMYCADDRTRLGHISANCQGLGLGGPHGRMLVKREASEALEFIRYSFISNQGMV